MATTSTARQLVHFLDPLVVSRPANSILEAVRRVSKQVGRTYPPRLVAVSKHQPVEKIETMYEEGLRHFGENYPQELFKKAQYLQEHGADIHWHFLGHLQRRKEKVLAKVPGLWMVESVDSRRCARLLDREWGEKGERLRVLVQVNTSREPSKHGCPPEACVDIAQYILEDCPYLLFCGLMTIGRLDHCHHTQGPNPDFLTLLQCGQEVRETLPLELGLELSFGMSGDYKHAIQLGSTNVRIGTALFGPRPQPST